LLKIIRFLINLDFKLLGLITEQFGKETEEINGAWINVRHNVDVVSIWAKTATNAESQFKIG
jgi:hypothetical protein